MRNKTVFRGVFSVGILTSSLALTACNGVNYPSASGSGSNATPASASTGAPSGAATGSTTSNGNVHSYTTAVLLFNGTGVSTSDWQSTESILKSHGISYQLADTSQLEALTLDQLATFGTIVVPGGEGGTIAGSLSTATRLKLRQAVRDRGMGYVGMCAGAWVAVGPEENTNSTASYGFAVAQGDVLPAYYPNGNTSLTAAVVNVSFASGTSRNMIWWGGPSTPEWAHGVVARYPDHSPAISETQSGLGYVVISGTHPEAPSSWQGTAGTDPDGTDFDIFLSMVNAVLTRTPLPTY